MKSVSRRDGSARGRIAARILLVAMCAALLYLAGRIVLLRPLRPYPAPDFVLRDLNGSEVRLPDYRGKAVVVNFWATWCAPCRAEMPWFIELEREYAPQGLEIIGVDEDNGAREMVTAFVKKAGVNYPVLLDDGRVSAAYGATEVLPATYYIARDGKVVGYVKGALSRSEVERAIREILAQPARGAGEVGGR